MNNADKRQGLNIRIVGMSAQFLQRSSSNKPFAVYITEGFDDKIENCNKRVVINYCPFCGVNLSSFYTAEYIQDVLHV